MKKLISVRISDLTALQLHELARLWGTRQTETIAICIERTYQQEMSMTSQPKTYRVTTKAGADLYVPSGYTEYILDQSTDLDASTETELVGEFLVDGSIAAAFERTLDASPAVVRWEEVPGNWPAPVR